MGVLALTLVVCEVRSPHRGWLAAGLTVSHQAAVFEA